MRDSHADTGCESTTVRCTSGRVSLCERKRARVPLFPNPPIPHSSHPPSSDARPPPPDPGWGLWRLLSESVSSHFQVAQNLIYLTQLKELILQNCPMSLPSPHVPQVLPLLNFPRGPQAYLSISPAGAPSVCPWRYFWHRLKFILLTCPWDILCNWHSHHLAVLIFSYLLVWCSSWTPYRHAYNLLEILVSNLSCLY